MRDNSKTKQQLITELEECRQKAAGLEKQIGSSAHPTSTGVMDIQNNEFNRNLLELAPTPILLFDPDYSIKYVNPAFVEISGYSADEVVGAKPPYPFWPKNDTPNYLSSFLNSFLNGAYKKAMSFRKKSGQVFWVEINSRSVFVNGLIQYYIATWNDITARKIYEELLQETTQRYSSLFEYHPDAAFSLDFNGRFLSVNGSACNLFGFSREYILNKSFLEMVATDDLKRIRGYLELANSGVPESYEIRVKHDSRQEIDLSITNVPIVVDGKVVGLYGIAKNITESKRVEQKALDAQYKLKESEEKYRQLVNNLHEGIWVIDKDTVTTFVNPHMAEILGYSPEEMIGKCLSAFINKNALSSVQSSLDDCKNGLKEQHEFELISKNGTSIHTIVEMSPITDISGKHEGVLFGVLDITDRKQMLDQITAEKNKLHSFIDAVDQGITIFDTDSNIIFQNSRSIEQSGDCKGQKCYKAIEGLDHVCAGCPVQDSLQDGKIHTSVRKIIDLKGNKVIFENTVAPIFDAKGKITSILELGRDVTERYRTQEALEESEEKYRILVENANQAVVVVQDGKFKYFNGKTLSISGYSAEEFSSSSFLDFVFPEDRHMVAEYYGNRLKGLPSPPIYEFRFVKKDNAVLWLENNAVLISWDNRQATLHLLTDITERKRMLEQITNEKNKLQSFINAIDFNIHICDTDYNTIFMNIKSTQSFGDFIGQKCYKTIGKQNTICQDCPVKLCLEDGKIHTTEKTIDDPGQPTKILENTAVPIFDSNGKIISVLELGKDITNHRKLLAQITEERNKLQSLINAIDNEITIIDKEFNITYVGTNSPDLYGDCLGQKCYKIFENADQICPDCPVQLCFKDGKVHTSERTIINSLGQRIIENIVSPILDVNGYIVSVVELGRDITDRHLLLEQITNEKNKLQAFVNAVDGSITLIDSDLNVLFQNKGSIDESGDVKGKKCYRNFAGRDSACPDCPVLKSFSDGLPHTYDPVITDLKGRARFHENTATPIFDSAGKIVSVLEFGRDVTVLKQLLAQTTEQRNKLEAFVNAIDGSIQILDPDYKVVFQNVFSVKDGGVIDGQLCYKAIHNRETTCPDCPAVECFKDNLIHKIERTIIDTNGDIRVHENTATPIFDAAGKVVSVLELGKDITEHKNMIEQLTHEKNKLQSITDSMEYSLNILDLDYNILYQNRYSDNHHGRHLKEKCYCIFEHKNYICDGCPVELARKDGLTHVVEREVIHPDGKQNIYEVTASCIKDGNGNIVSCVESVRDITERKQMTETITLERNKLQSLINVMDCGVCIKELDFTVSYQNDFLNKLFGECTGMKCYQGFEKRDSICPDCHLLLCQQDGKVHNQERQNVSPDGKIRYFESTASPIRGPHGEIVSVLEMINEVTKFKEAEKSIQDSEEKLRRIFQATNEGIVVTDLQGIAVDVNTRMTELIGFSQEQLIGKSAFSFLLPDSLQSAQDNWLELLKSGQAKSKEYTGIKGDGSKLIVEANASLLRDNTGKPTGCVLSMRDATERKQMIDQLVAEKNKLQSFIDAISSDITIRDMDFNLIFQNNISINQFGSFIGRKCYEVYGGRTDICQDCAAAECIKRGETFTTERKHTLPNGTTRYVECIASPIRNADGNIISVLELTSDISERKEMVEEIISEKNKLQSFIDSISGEITIRDLDFNLTYQNSISIGIMGDCTGKKCYKSFEGFDSICPDCPAVECLKREKTYTSERKHILHNGTFRVIECSASPIRDAEGNITSILELTTDISERKEMVEEIISEKNKLQSFIDSISSDITIRDLDFNLTYQNSKSISVFGDCSGRKCYKSFDGFDDICPDCAAYQSLQDGKTHSSEHKVLLGNGRTIYYENVASPIRNSEGNIISLVELSTNITERKLAEEQLKQSELKFRALFEQSQDGITLINQDGIIIGWNNAQEHLTGLKRDVTLNKPISEIMLDLMPASLRNNASASLQHRADVMMNSNQSKNTHNTFEKIIQRPDGEQRIIQFMTFQIEMGDDFMTSSISRDITHRKKSEEALLQSEKKYRSLVNNIKLGIFRCTHGEKGKFLEINKAMEQITGYSREELLFMNVADLYKNPEVRISLLDGLALSPNNATIEYDFKKKDGQEIIISDTSVAVKDDAGIVMYYDGILEDITERKKMDERIIELYEKEKAQRQELQEEAKARGLFIDVLAHELRTPLTPILASTSMLQDLQRFRPETIQTKLSSNIYSSAQVLAHRLEELLDIARYSRGTFKLQIQPIDIHKYIKEVSDRFKPTLDQRKQVLHLELAPDLPVIEADPSRLEQVVTNLLSNAGKFSPDGGNILLRVTVKSNELFVDIQDEGIGISSQEHGRLFQPYHRVEQDRQRFPGIGLGLAVSKQIIEAHGGVIGVTSEIGKGSTFSFHIPVKRVK